MATWHEYVNTEGTPPEWPYPIKFGEEREIDVDVLVIGGGIAGSWAAISAARQGVKVALLEKGDVKRSGSGGPGCDHWCNVPCNPHSRVDPDEWAAGMAEGRYKNGIGYEIQCRENYDTLLEMEQMGGKIRDTDDEFLGVEGRHDDTKFMISPRYGINTNLLPEPGAGEPGFNPPEKRSNVVIRIWGSTFKPSLKKECKRLGVMVFDRVMGTSLLNEDGIKGKRVVGATAINNRTGEFLIFKAKSVIISTAGAGSMWLLSTEQGGISNMKSRNDSGDGTVMAWKAGATLTAMERTSRIGIATGMKHKWYTGAGDASYENVPIVDANGKRVPFPIQGWEDAGAMAPNFKTAQEVREGVMKGEYELPFYGDFPAMPEIERRATWNMMLNEESTTKIMITTMKEGGFDIGKDQLISYKMIEGESLPQWGEIPTGGGILVDWDLKTSLDGLYAAGSSMFCPQDHSFCASTGRYAGRKAAKYAKSIEAGKIDRAQIDKEKERVLAPTKRTSGIEWKELHQGLARAMQYYNSEFKTERLMKMGLDEIGRIEENAVPKLFALDPHKLMRSLEDLSMIEFAKIVLHAQLERKASSMSLGLRRIDYPEMDPPEWDHFMTITNTEDGIKFGELPQKFWGNMKEEYEAHNKDYEGVYNPEAK